MATSFEALRDDRVDSAFVEPPRLLDSGGIADDDRAACSDPLEQGGLRQPEVEADDRRPDLLDNGGHFRVEGRTHRTAVARLDPELLVIRSQQCPPCAVVSALRHGVTEEVEG